MNTMPKEATMLQLYVQFKDTESRFEDYVCTIQYRYADFGQITDFNIWKGHYCGQTMLQ